MIALGGGALGVGRDARAACASARSAPGSTSRPTTAWAAGRGAPARASAGRRRGARSRCSHAQRAAALRGRRGCHRRRGDDRAEHVAGALAPAGLDARRRLARLPSCSATGAVRDRRRRRSRSRRAAPARRSRSRAARRRSRRPRWSGSGARSPSAELERARRVVCAGGGSVTDVGGFAAATFRRGLAVDRRAHRRWSARSTRRSAARPPSTSPRRTTSARSGSPRRVLCDPELLETLPPREWAGGMAEVVKTALLVGGPLLGAGRGLGARAAATIAPRSELVQRCAGVKTLVVAERSRRARAPRDPQPRAHDRPRRRGGGRLRRASRTASASRSAWSPRCGSRSGCTASPRRTRRGTVAQLLSATGCPCARPGSTRTPCWRRCAHDKKRTAGTHRHGAAGGDRAARLRRRRRRATCSPTRYALLRSPTRLTR